MDQLSQTQTATAEAITALARKQQPEPEPEDENLYEPNTLLRKAEQVMERKLQIETAKNAKIAEMGKEYPEIHSDTKLMDKVVGKLKALPQALQGTPEGYEMAIRRAVDEQGLIPKSRRRDTSVDEDVSFGNNQGGGIARTAKKGKASADQLELASLLGMDVNNPKYVERLEKTINSRSDYKKWE